MSPIKQNGGYHFIQLEFTQQRDAQYSSIKYSFIPDFKNHPTLIFLEILDSYCGPNLLPDNWFEDTWICNTQGCVYIDMINPFPTALEIKSSLWKCLIPYWGPYPQYHPVIRYQYIYIYTLDTDFDWKFGGKSIWSVCLHVFQRQNLTVVLIFERLLL